MSSAHVSRIREIEWFRRTREDPPGYRSLAAEALRTESDPSVRGLLHAVIARAALELHDMDEARTHAEHAAASRVGTRAPLAEPQLRARVVALQSLVLMRLGDLTGATTVLDVPDVLDDHARGLIASQRSAVLYTGGALGAALVAADEAVLRLGRREPIDRARALNNRAIIRLYLGGAAGGLADFVEAEALLRSEGLAFLAADVAHNRGMMLARLGDLPAALETFTRAEDELASLGAPIDVQLVARAEILALAGLVEDVVEMLPPVIDRLDDTGMAATAEEARLTLAIAQTELALPEAVATAARAAAAFASSGRSGWAAIAADVELQAMTRSGGPGAVDPARAVDVAEGLEGAGMQVFSGAAWLRAAAAAVSADDTATALAALERVRRRKGGVVERLHACEAAARHHALVGDRAAARRSAERGLRLLERHRQLFEATELRVRASAWGDGLSAVMIELAADIPNQLFIAAERWRATALSSPGSRPTDPALDTLLADYRSAHAGLATAVRDEVPTGEATERLAQAERAVAGLLRQRRARHPEVARPAPTPFDTSRLDLAHRALVEFVVVGGELRAVVAHADTWTIVGLGPIAAIQRMVAATLAGLRQLAAGLSGPASGLLSKSVRSQLDRLRVALVEPIDVLVRDAAEVLVVPVGPLHSVPWLRFFGRPVALAPSAAMWSAAGSSRTGSLTGDVVVVAGPGLLGADEEVTSIGAVHHGAAIRRGDEATIDETRTLSEGAALLHVACHAQFRSANPLFSHLVLADGPMTAFELERLHRPPELIVLSACSTGQVSQRSAGEPLGLTRLLLSAGTAAVVASVLPLPDLAAVPRMIEFHRGLARGMPVGPALVQAVAAGDEGDPEQLVISCALACFGRADRRLSAGR